MGTSDSTRWNDHQKARTVEQCMQLEIATFTQHDLANAGLDLDPEDGTQVLRELIEGR